MDKVIIDKVDVSGCEFFSDMSNGKPDTICKCYKDMYGFNTNCEHNKDAKNCYYKQLQRAKAEIEELKKQVRNNETAYHTELGTYNMECGNLLEENKNLIEENEQLKADIESRTMCITCTKENENCRLQVENDRLKKNSCKYKEYCTCDTEKFIQAMQEIREIAEEQLQDVSDRCINTTPMYIVHKYIIDKINEVIGAE